MRRLIPAGIALAAFVLFVMLVASFGGESEPKPEPLTSLIHTACKGNEDVYDWTVDNGHVNVWCYDERQAFPIGVRVVTVR